MCFALWRWAQAFFDADRCGSDFRGIARRIVYGAAGGFYAAFASVAIFMCLGSRTANTERVIHHWTSWALRQPSGRWTVGLAGASIVIAAIGIGVTGVRAEFKARLDLKEKPKWFVTALGCVSYLTRAAVFSVIGLFVIFAAIDSNAHEATGLAG